MTFAGARWGFLFEEFIDFLRPIEKKNMKSL